MKPCAIRIGLFLYHFVKNPAFLGSVRAGTRHAKSVNLDFAVTTVMPPISGIIGRFFVIRNAIILGVVHFKNRRRIVL